jgi:carbon storage regulator
MLFLIRKVGQSIIIGDDIVINLAALSDDGKATIGISAPKSIPVHREEVYLYLKRNKKQDNEK